jgi:hypothetical protein
MGKQGRGWQAGVAESGGQVAGQRAWNEDSNDERALEGLPWGCQSGWGSRGEAGKLVWQKVEDR